MTNPNYERQTSILGKVKADAYNDGWSQAMQVNTDSSFIDGMEQAYSEAPRRIRWFLFGAVIAAIIVGYFV